MNVDQKPKKQNKKVVEGTEVLNLELLDLKNKLARALADYDNLQKRVERERVDFVKFASLRLATRLLPILDIIDSASLHTKDQGVTIAASQFRDVLKDNGFEEIKPKVGEVFDANFEEAIEMVTIEDKNKDGQIAELLLSGWKLVGGQVVRPAKVKVFKLKL